MGSTRRSFTTEYKAEAVNFVLDGGRTITEVARNIGCHELTLGKWVKKEKDARKATEDATDAPLSDSERAELVRLRSELKDANATVAELRMQVEFAKKVATWFAKDKQ
jgi:transposase